MASEKSVIGGMLLAAICFAVMAQVIHTAGAFLAMSYYTDPAYFPVWSKLMMPANGAPPAEFFLLSIVFSFIEAIMFAGAYSVLMKAIPGKGTIMKGMNYGAILFLVAALPGTLSMSLLINLPVELLGMWAIENLVVLLLGGIIIAKLVKQ